MRLQKNFSVLLATLALCACSDGWFGDSDERPPLPGERISVLDFEKDLRPDENLADTVFTAPEAIAHPAWPQAGGTPAHDMGHHALSGKELQRVWSTDIGEGSRSKIPLTTQPVVIGESIFTLDTDARLSSFSTGDGARRWSADVRHPDEEDPVIGGGIAAHNGVLYVTAGYDEVVAVDAQSGQIKWRSALPAPSRAAPTAVNGTIYVTTLNNTLYALNETDGTIRWEFAGLSQSTGLVGAASPAISGELVLPAFSSGEIYALRTANGSIAWSDNLANTLRLGGMTGLSDIRALPVVKDGAVYAISFGGKMAAIDLFSGARIWQRDISGAETPAVIGNRVFVITNEGQIVAMNRADGAVVWVSQLARFGNKEEHSDPIFWTGPLMAGGRLLAFSSDGRVAEIDPDKGALVREWRTGKDVRIAPVIVNGTLYILAEDGDLIAYR